MVCSEINCNDEKELNNINFIPNKQMKNGYLSRCRDCQNKLRKEKSTKYKYFYEIDINGILKKDKIKATSKKNAKRILRFRYPNLVVLKLYTKKRIR